MDIHETARAVCRSLSGFTYIDDARQRDGQGELYHAARITSAFDAPHVANPVASSHGVPWTDRPMQLYVSTSAVKGKLCVSLDVPRVEIGGSGVWLGDAVRGRVAASINVSATRDAKSIAGEIERRLVGTASANWAIMLAWVAERESYQATENAACDSLRAIGATFGAHRADMANHGSLRTADECFSFVVNGERVSFKYLTLDLGAAVTVLGALATVQRIVSE